MNILIKRAAQGWIAPMLGGFAGGALFLLCGSGIGG
jgi:hypothetical protein